MKRIVTLLLIALCARPAAGQSVVVFRAVNVVPLDSEQIVRDRTVIVQDGWIAAVGPADELAAPDGATVIDGSGLFLMPGLVDMHVHLELEPAFQDALLDVLLAHGVTSVLNNWGGPYTRALRDRSLTSERMAPRVFSSGPGIDDSELGFAAGRDLARRERRAGFEFAKVYTGLSEQGFKGVVAGAGEVGLRVIGHVPASLGLEVSLASGLELVTHVEELINGHLRFQTSDVARPPEQDLDPERIEEIVALVAENGSSVTTTLIALVRILDVASDYPGVLAREEIGLVPPAIRAELGWRPDSRYARTFTTSAHHDRLRALFAYALELTGALQRAGVPLLAGTDAMNPGCVPGPSLHAELALLVDAGLTPYEALVAATRAPAEFLGLDAVSGTVEAAKRADLLLLEANPLEDIGNVARIVGVMVDGRWRSAGDSARVLVELRETHALQAEFLEALAAGDVDVAFGLLERAGERKLFSESSLIDAARALARAGASPDEALGVYGLLVDSYPGSARAWAELAEAQLRAGAGADAIASLERALDLDPQGRVGRAAAARLEAVRDQ